MNESINERRLEVVFFFAEKDAPSVYKKRDGFFLKFHLYHAQNSNFGIFFRHFFVGPSPNSWARH